MPFEKTILVVDDSRSVRKLIKLRLSEAGYQVVEADSGKEALKILKDRTVDLITLDIEMPEMNGYEVCAAIRQYERDEERAESIPIVMLTGHDSIEGRQKGFDAGATNFSTKSNHGTELISRVKSLLEPNNRYSSLGILVIDDSPAVRQLIIQILTEMNIRVLTAENGAHGLEVFKSNPMQIDMILTDLEMPEMNGEELCRKIRSELSYKNLPIVVITGDDSQNRAINLFKAGATEYIRKPFIQEELIARISIHLEKILIERDLRAVIEELNTATQLKDKFLGICSHDLRSPLAGIIGCASIVAKCDALNAGDKKMLSLIESNAQDMMVLVSDLLDLSSLKQISDKMVLVPLSLHEELGACVTQQKSFASRKNIELDFISTAMEARVLGSSSALKRVANNLLSNAIKFTPRGGKIEFEIKEVPGNKVSLQVRDNGVGIPKSKLGNIFDSFTRAGRKGTEGEVSTGLGLSIVKELLEKHGCRIDVESEEGKGSTFSMIFDKVS